MAGQALYDMHFAVQQVNSTEVRSEWPASSQIVNKLLKILYRPLQTTGFLARTCHLHLGLFPRDCRGAQSYFVAAWLQKPCADYHHTFQHCLLQFIMYKLLQ